MIVQVNIKVINVIVNKYTNDTVPKINKSKATLYLLKCYCFLVNEIFYLNFDYHKIIYQICEDGKLAVFIYTS